MNNKEQFTLMLVKQAFSRKEEKPEGNSMFSKAVGTGGAALSLGAIPAFMQGSQGLFDAQRARSLADLTGDFKRTNNKALEYLFESMKDGGLPLKNLNHYNTTMKGDMLKRLAKKQMANESVFRKALKTRGRAIPIAAGGAALASLLGGYFG